MMLGLCGGLGQIFIYFTLSLFDGYKVSIITTTRKCMSIVASNFIFNHRFTQEQWIGASIVMASACLEVVAGKNKKVEKTD